jgi:hypothetical protein
MEHAPTLFAVFCPCRSALVGPDFDREIMNLVEKNVGTPAILGRILCLVEDQLSTKVALGPQTIPKHQQSTNTINCEPGVDWSSNNCNASTEHHDCLWGPIVNQYCTWSSNNHDASKEHGNSLSEDQLSTRVLLGPQTILMHQQRTESCTWSSNNCDASTEHQDCLWGPIVNQCCTWSSNRDLYASTKQRDCLRTSCQPGFDSVLKQISRCINRAWRLQGKASIIPFIQMSTIS